MLIESNCIYIIRGECDANNECIFDKINKYGIMINNTKTMDDGWCCADKRSTRNHSISITMMNAKNKNGELKNKRDTDIFVECQSQSPEFFFFFLEEKKTKKKSREYCSFIRTRPFFHISINYYLKNRFFFVFQCSRDVYPTNSKGIKRQREYECVRQPECECVLRTLRLTK